MAIITNYSTLVQAIQSIAEDDGQEYADYIPVAIDLAEEKLFREIELPELEVEESGSFTANQATVTKPTGYEFGDHFSLVNGTSKVTLKKKLKSFINDYWQDATQTGIPKYYCDNTATTFLVAPTPSSTYTYSVRFVKKPTKLDSGPNTTNYFTDNCKDLLYAASMLEMVKFMKAWSQIQIWEAEYNRLKESWNVQAMRYRRDGSDVPMGPGSGPNTLKHTIQSQA